MVIMENCHRKITFTLFILIVLTMVVGCGSEGDRGRVLADVNGDKIYEDEVDGLLEREKKNFTTFEDEYKYRRAIVDTLVIQRLLIQEAYERNIDDLEEVQRLVLGNKDKFLLDILYLREIEDKATITDKELQDWYDKMEYRYKVSHILVSSEDTANVLLDSLQNGGNFEQLAVAYSIDPSAQQNRGELNYFVWGQMIPDFQEKVILMNPGELSKPFKTRFGWHIVKMIDKSPNPDRRSFDAMKDEIEVALKNNKKSKLMEDFNNALRERVAIKVDTGTVQYLMHKREAIYPPQILENLPKNDYDINQLDRNDKELILASWDGGQITVGEYLGKIDQLKGSVRLPDLTDTDALEEFIFQLNVMELLAADARRKGLENDPDFKRKLNQFKELTMADVMRNDSLQLPDPPDEGQIREYYDDHLDEFRQPPSIDAYEILVPSKDSVLKFKREIRSLKRFKEIAGQVTERGGKRKESGHLGYINERAWGRIYRAADATPLGGISEPVEMANGLYSIVYVQDKQGETVKDYNAVRGQIYSKLEREVRNKVFEEWIETKKAESNIDINENNIRASIDKDKYEDTGNSEG